MMKEKSLFETEKLCVFHSVIKNPRRVTLRGLNSGQLSTYNTTNRLLTTIPSLSNRSRYMPGLIWLI